MFSIIGDKIIFEGYEVATIHDESELPASLVDQFRTSISSTYETGYSDGYDNGYDEGYDKASDDLSV